MRAFIPFSVRQWPAQWTEWFAAGWDCADFNKKSLHRDFCERSSNSSINFDFFCLD